MLKRIVKEATDGFSSGGEQVSRKKKPTPRRAATSSDEESANQQNSNKRGEMPSRKHQKSSRDDTEEEPPTRTRKRPTETESDQEKKTMATNDSVRRKKASRKKREPLLGYNVIETVHSAIHGKTKKRARQELLETFGSYDPDDTGTVAVEKFKKCIIKVGIKLKRTSDVDALVRCFSKTDGKEDLEDDSSDSHTKATTTKVDYTSFVDFACNVRDSEKLSAVAEKLRGIIRVYDDKHDRATTVPYNISTDLKKLDRNKRGWIASDRFSDFMQDHERPTFRLAAKDVALLTERFEYEYDKGTLGFDYQQFAQWLQPMLNLNKKELHERVKHLIVAAQENGGWELGKIFEAIDDSGDGHVSGAELKKGLFDMGLPLTDGQIHCLVEEYDTNGDGKIQYGEFVSLFQAPKKAKKPLKRSDEDESDATKRRRSKARANVRNTFSWAISKAFARKHAQANKQKGDRERNIRRASSSDSEEKRRKSKSSKGKPQVQSTTDSDSRNVKKRPRSNVRSNRRSESLEESDTSGSDHDSAKKKKHETKKKISKKMSRTKHSSTESEEVAKRPRSPKRKSTKRTKSSGSDSDEPSSQCGRKRRSDSESGGEAIKRTSRTQSFTAKPSQTKSEDRRRKSRERSRATSGREQQTVGRRRRDSHTNNATRKTSQVRRKRSQELEVKRHNSSEAHHIDGDENNQDFESGLDLDEVRKMQRRLRVRGDANQSRSDLESSGDDSEGEAGEGSKSDHEFQRALKKSLQRAFEFFDSGHTGTIDKRELGHVLRALGHEYSSRELDREMRHADVDKNGELDFYEFFKFVKKQLRQKVYLLSKRREMEVRQAFQVVDSSKSGCLDGNQFEFLVYKVLQVELSVEEQDALLDIVENPGDGTVHEDALIDFMKTMESFHKNGRISAKRQRKMTENLDPTSRLACSAAKKLIRGAPVDLDKNLLMLLGVPTNFRPALTSAEVCRELYENSLEHVLSFPCPETIVGLAQDPIRVSAKKESSILNLGRTSPDGDDDDAKLVLSQAELWQAHAIVSLKRATGVPKPFDTREEDVIKRCVHVALYQEQDPVVGKRRSARGASRKHVCVGVIVGNVHEVPVYWNPQEEDVWEFSRKTTKEDKYKFLVRTNNLNDRLHLLVEFIVHLRMASKVPKRKKHKLKIAESTGEVREMTACWCKIPLRSLLAPRVEVSRTKEKLWGGTVQSPIDIEEDEILRRRTGWRAFANAFKKPTPPLVGVKSAPIQSYPEDVQALIRKMPPLIIAPFVSLPIIGEYMTAMQSSLWIKFHSMSPNLCEPVLKLLPRIIDDHEALSVFRRVFDSEMSGLKSLEDRQRRFHALVLRMWPSFLELAEKLPDATLQQAKVASVSTRRLSLLPTANASAQAPAKGTTNHSPPQQHARFDLLQCTAQGKLSLRDVPVAATPFHVREVAFERLI